MTKPPRRWDVIAPRLKDAREKGLLGVVAAATGIAEYKLHDVVKLETSPGRKVLKSNEVSKLWKYFEGKKS